MAQPHTCATWRRAQPAQTLNMVITALGIESQVTTTVLKHVLKTNLLAHPGTPGIIRVRSSCQGKPVRRGIQLELGEERVLGGL